MFRSATGRSWISGVYPSENIPIVPLYYAKERPRINLDGNIIMADDVRLPEKYRDQIEMKMVRFRTWAGWPLTGAVESGAATIEEIVEEMMTTKSERTLTSGSTLTRKAAWSRRKT